MMNTMHVLHRLGLLSLLLAGASTFAAAITVTASYVKTLGLTRPDDQYLLTTVGGRIAVDEKGDVYCGTPGGSSYIQKIAPDGKILWQFFTNVPGYQGTAVDDKYLYTCGSGYYGYIQLQRRLRDTGELALGWQYEWQGGAAQNGVRTCAWPCALAVDEKYLFVADAGANEIRRFDKATGKEAPFTDRLMVVQPVDIAISQTGMLLILTDQSVVEVDKEGNAKRAPLIGGLKAPTAIDINRKTGDIYLAEGGDNQLLINRIRVYSADGKPLNVEIGIGGDFSGKWHPLSFAFSCGAGDITLDPNGGIWVNGYGHLMGLCPILTHLSPGPQFKPELTLRSVLGTGIVTDQNLDVYVGGSYKITWDDQLKWTSGLIDPGPAGLFPTTLSTWSIFPVWSDGKTAIIAQVHGNTLYQVNAKNGAALGKSLGTGGPSIAGSCVVGRDLFYSIAGARTIQRTTVDLEPPQSFVTLPENASPASGVIAVSPDEQLVYIASGGNLGCYRRDGTTVWSKKSGLGPLFKGLLFTPNPAGSGVTVLDAGTGNPVTTFGDKAVNGRPPFGAGSMSISSKDGVDYLFIQSAGRVLVYRIVIG